MSVPITIFGTGDPVGKISVPIMELLVWWELTDQKHNKFTYATTGCNNCYKNDRIKGTKNTGEGQPLKVIGSEGGSRLAIYGKRLLGKGNRGK